MYLIKHLKTVLIHKYHVFRACIDCGIPFRGLVHDLSKLSLSEIYIYKYYSGTYSPIVNEKKSIGYSSAWQHHKCRNKHHWQYWLDEEDGSIYPIKIPIKYLIELVCDYIGAGKAYDKTKWTKDTPLNYYNTQKDKIIMHKDSKQLLEDIFIMISEEGWYKASRYLKTLKEYPKY